MKNINKYIKESIAAPGVLVKSKNELIKTIKDSLDKGVVDLNFIDTSKITDMSSLFYKGVELAKYDKSIQETIVTCQSLTQLKSNLWMVCSIIARNSIVTCQIGM